jgi:hypothetical protein
MKLKSSLRVSECTTHTSLSPIRRRFALDFVNYKNGALDSHLQVIKFTSYLPMVGVFLKKKTDDNHIAVDKI